MDHDINVLCHVVRSYIQAFNQNLLLLHFGKCLCSKITESHSSFHSQAPAHNICDHMFHGFFERLMGSLMWKSVTNSNVSSIEGATDSLGNLYLGKGPI